MNKKTRKWNKNWKVKEGHNVKVHYVGTFGDGEEFDSSYSRGQTLDFKVGASNMIKGFNDAVLNMKKGQKKKVILQPEIAYGQYQEIAIRETPKAAFPKDFDFVVGHMVRGTSPNGMPVMAKIVSLNENTVVLDHNHPLAGKDLTFEIELVDAEKDN